ncbi:VOC family protein [Erythrobacter sp. HL-111]|uniref:VOC family protein n=1 Tax=Erythrobacter sp. HL-111 TaxID=1798193 RepID=UPI0006DA2151|nr:VOC family protein [Erythrobacter sp. HL-111]KPP91145.1 MAG: Glyoxalase-like domain [Erythrobacteraceae bacterium HL-111]SDS45917.1 hypothetical protein SAMN04515621_1605 [Erythrobacter sp. HL-111]
MSVLRFAMTTLVMPDYDAALDFNVGALGFAPVLLETASFAESHARFTASGVTFEGEPRHEAYGTVAVFRDPFGNRWDLIEPKAHE